MRRPRYITFVCPFSDKHQEERFVETADDGSPLETQRCGLYLDTNGVIEQRYGIEPHCDGVMSPQEFGVGYAKSPLLAPIQRGNHDYNERERARLEKRGDDHWKRQGRDEAIDRERALFKKHGADGAGGVK